MEAPDKIFISVKRTYGASDGQVIAMATPHNERQSVNDVEYIRKDALLEWAKDWQDELDDSLGASMVHHVLNEVIKKIESL